MSRRNEYDLACTCEIFRAAPCQHTPEISSPRKPCRNQPLRQDCGGAVRVSGGGALIAPIYRTVAIEERRFNCTGRAVPY